MVPVSNKRQVEAACCSFSDPITTSDNSVLLQSCTKYSSFFSFDQCTVHFRSTSHRKNVFVNRSLFSTVLCNFSLCRYCFYCIAWVILSVGYYVLFVIQFVFIVLQIFIHHNNGSTTTIKNIIANSVKQITWVIYDMWPCISITES